MIRKCCYNKLPKDNNKHKYVSWHTGSTFVIENKLGNYLSIIITIQLYNMYFTIPFTSLFLSISSFIMIFIDKLTFIHFNRIPFKYNSSLLQTYNTTLYWFTTLTLLFNIHFSLYIYYDLPSTFTIVNAVKLIIMEPLFILLCIVTGLCVVAMYFV